MSLRLKSGKGQKSHPSQWSVENDALESSHGCKQLSYTNACVSSCIPFHGVVEVHGVLEVEVDPASFTACFGQGDTASEKIRSGLEVGSSSSEPFQHLHIEHVSTYRPEYQLDMTIKVRSLYCYICESGSFTVSRQKRMQGK